MLACIISLSRWVARSLGLFTCPTDWMFQAPDLQYELELQRYSRTSQWLVCEPG